MLSPGREVAEGPGAGTEAAYLRELHPEPRRPVNRKRLRFFPFDRSLSRVDREPAARYFTINDKASGLTLVAKQKVAKDTSAFDAVRHIVGMAYRTDPAIGPVVTSLCGVPPAKGSAWSCSIDGQVPSNLARVGLKADVTIGWKTVPVI